MIVVPWSGSHLYSVIIGMQIYAIALPNRHVLVPVGGVTSPFGPDVVSFDCNSILELNGISCILHRFELIFLSGGGYFDHVPLDAIISHSITDVVSFHPHSGMYLDFMYLA